MNYSFLMTYTFASFSIRVSCYIFLIFISTNQTFIMTYDIRPWLMMKPLVHEGEIHEDDSNRVYFTKDCMLLSDHSDVDRSWARFTLFLALLSI